MELVGAVDALCDQAIELWDQGDQWAAARVWGALVKVHAKAHLLAAVKSARSRHLQGAVGSCWANHCPLLRIPSGD